MNLNVYDIMILIGIPSISAFIFQLIYNTVSTNIKKDKMETKMIRTALQALLRDRLREHYNEHVDKGYIDMADKDNFDNMYQIYHKLGKNGVMDGMYNKVMNLPLTKPRPKNSSRKKIEEESESLN